MAQNDDTNVSPCRPLMVVGRYAIYGEIASGGMATVHLGRLLGPVGFSRTVAIKRLHAHLAKDPEFTAMFLDEARLAARIRHPNVVSTLDVGASKGELFLVMEYVHGEPLGQLLRQMTARKERMPLGIAGNLISGMLQGLHAAHEARSDRGEPLGIVHRDVSPQNLLVGMDGAPRLVDFGVAKAMGRVTTTRGGEIKGKVAYMAPEQILGKEVTRRTDVWGAGAVLWQVLTGRKLFTESNDAEMLYKIIAAEVPPPSQFAEGVPPEIDEVVLRALAKEPEDRFDSAHEMAVACEKALPIVSQREVAEWMDGVASAGLSRLAARVAEIESLSGDVQAVPSIPPVKTIVTPHEGKVASYDPLASTVPPPPSMRRKRSRLWPILAASGVALGVAGGFVASAWLRANDKAAGQTPSASLSPIAPTIPTLSAVGALGSPSASVSAGPSADPRTPSSVALAGEQPSAVPANTAGTPGKTAATSGTRTATPKSSPTKKAAGGESLYVRE